MKDLVTERTSLLDTDISENEVLDTESLVSKNDDCTTNTATEIRYIAWNSVPNCISFLLQYCINAFSIFFVSRLGKDELASTSLAVHFYHITGPAIMMGMATAIDTLSSQAFGAKNYRLVGLYLYKNLFISFTLMIPLSFVWMHSNLILGSFIDDPKIVELTSKYIHIVILEAPAFVMYENGKKFLQTQGIFHATTKVLAIVVPIHLMLDYTLILHPKYAIGFIGAPISSVLSYWLLAILLYSYIFFVEGSKCLQKVKLIEIVSDLSELIKLNFFGVIMLLSETFAFQLITFLATQLHDLNQMAAQSIVLTISNYFFQIPFAIGVVASTRTGNYIGKGQRTNAKITIRCVYIISIALGLFNFFLVFLNRGNIASVFSKNDPVLHAIIKKNLIIVATFQLIDSSLNICSAGILRAQGRQSIGGGLSLISYYGVGLFFEILFAFKLHMKLFGLWCGLLVGISFLSFAEFFAVVYSDWDSIIKRSRTRNDQYQYQ